MAAGIRTIAMEHHIPAGAMGPEPVVLVGDCLGVVSGRLVRAPEQFTADLEVAEQTLHSLLPLRGSRMLFGHGPELANPWGELEAVLGS
jgi:hypothetical protein